MKKGYFIHYNARDIIGVSKKIDMQIMELAKHFAIEEIDIKIKNKSFIRNMFAVLPFISIDWDYSKAYTAIKNPDFLYIRSGGDDYRFYQFIKYIKKVYPQCKIIVEIPTYPFLKECLRTIQGIVMFPKTIYNNYVRNKKYIDRYVTYTNNNIIMGIPTIKTKNGIDVKSINPVRNNFDYNQYNINIIMVATLQPSHGFERLIIGLYDYYKCAPKRKVYIHVAGEGRERPYYENLIRQYNLEKYIIMYGMCDGNELNELYNISDVACSFFGGYKAGIYLSSALKVREALAKGLPIITGVEEDVFAEHSEFCYYIQFPNDSSTINIDAIIKFLDDVYTNKTRTDLTEEIRNFALATIDIAIVMKPIIDYIKIL